MLSGAHPGAFVVEQLGITRSRGQTVRCFPGTNDIQAYRPPSVVGRRFCRGEMQGAAVNQQAPATGNNNRTSQHAWIPLPAALKIEMLEHFKFDCSFL